MNQSATAPANTAQVVIGWIWVGIPLVWGIYQTLLNVVKLFQ
jgi:hypothetical protein